jgi:type II secretory pathway pseudopilin PulG
MNKNKKYFKIAGYNLAELAIALTIISSIIGVGSTLLLGGTNAAKQADTENRMKIIEDAIAGFVAEYNRLPCAGDITLTSSATAAATEVSGCTGFTYSATIAAPSSPMAYTSTGTSIMVIGSVPYIALGLPKEYIADAWGNKFIYVLTQALSLYSFDLTNMGVISIKDASGAYRTQNAAYALISTGANGKGGFPMNGTSAVRKSAPTDAGELINYNGVQPSGSNAGFFIAREKSPTYDDIVHYRQKWQIVKEAGAVISNYVCAQAIYYIEAPSITVNGITHAELCQTNPNDENCNNYMSTMMYKIRDLCLKQY